MDNNNSFINPSVVGGKLPTDLSEKVEAQNEILNNIQNNIQNELTKYLKEMATELVNIREGINEINGIISNTNTVAPQVEEVATGEETPIEPVVTPEIETPVENVAPAIPEVNIEVPEVTPVENTIPETPVEDNSSSIISMDDLLQNEIQMPEVPNVSEPEISLPSIDNIVPATPEVAPAAPVENVAPAMPEVAPAAPVENVAPAMPEVAPAAPVDNGVEEVTDFYPTEVISSDSLQRSFVTPAGFNEKFMGKSNANVMTLEKTA